MRIGEITVLSTGQEEKKLFIQSVCQKLELVNENIAFGRLPINDQLVLHLYGVALQAEMAWDLLAQKCLGYIVLFPWQDAASFERLKPALDLLAARYEATMVVAAHVSSGTAPVPPALYESGIAVTAEGKFMFCDLRQPAGARKILLALIESLIEKVS
jgi:signal recognition particle receptor subunit beta